MAMAQCEGHRQEGAFLPMAERPRQPRPDATAQQRMKD